MSDAESGGSGGGGCGGEDEGGGGGIVGGDGCCCLLGCHHQIASLHCLLVCPKAVVSLGCFSSISSSLLRPLSTTAEPCFLCYFFHVLCLINCLTIFGHLNKYLCYLPPVR